MSRHRLPLLVAFVCSAGLLSGYARAVALIPDSVKSSSSPPQTVIQNFIRTQVANLQSTNPLTKKLARDQISTDATTRTQGVTVSPQYAELFTKELNAALLPMTRSPSLHERVNVGVVATDVAQRIVNDDGSAAALAPVVQALLSDPQAPVTLWGIKAAKYVMDSQIMFGGNPSPIAKLVVGAVKRNPDLGPIIEDAFKSFTFEDVKNQTDPQFLAGVTPMIPDLLDLLAWRGDQYKSGASTPSPLAEKLVPVFLSVTVYPAVSAKPDLLKRMLKVFGETTCATIHAVSNGNSSPELIEMIQAEGHAINAFGDRMANDNVKKAGDNIAKLSQATDPTRLGGMCDELAAALKGVGVDIAGGAGAEATPAPAVAGGSK